MFVLILIARPSRDVMVSIILSVLYVLKLITIVRLENNKIISVKLWNVIITLYFARVRRELLNKPTKSVGDKTRRPKHTIQIRSSEIIIIYPSIEKYAMVFLCLINVPTLVYVFVQFRRCYTFSPSSRGKRYNVYRGILHKLWRIKNNKTILIEWRKRFSSTPSSWYYFSERFERDGKTE